MSISGWKSSARAYQHNIDTLLVFCLLNNVIVLWSRIEHKWSYRFSAAAPVATAGSNGCRLSLYTHIVKLSEAAHRLIHITSIYSILSFYYNENTKEKNWTYTQKKGTKYTSNTYTSSSCTQQQPPPIRVYILYIIGKRVYSTSHVKVRQIKTNVCVAYIVSGIHLDIYFFRFLSNILYIKKKMQLIV